MDFEHDLGDPEDVWPCSDYRRQLLDLLYRRAEERKRKEVVAEAERIVNNDARTD